MSNNDAFKHQVKSANPLESVIGNYVTLKRSGRNYVCCCPFHSEKTPSFHINVSEGFYKCFGCGESGDVFSFIMKMENLDFADALKFLAERVGIPIPKWEKGSTFEKNSNERNTLFELNREARIFFYNNLKDKPTVLNYIKFTRNISASTGLSTYCLGYASNNWCDLTNHLRSKGFSDTDILKSGLAKLSNRGILCDFFRDRLIIPIIDTRGNTIAFGGRILDVNGKNTSAPKYLNSPDTPVFKKSEHLFSLNIAKKSINANNRTLILAEGYMDVIALYQGGFKNAVASLGTSLTPEQVNIIKRYADEVIICYDSDNAGINATNRAIALLLNGSTDKEIKIRVLQMTGAKDPDEYIKKYGSQEFQKLLDTSMDAIDFQLEQVRHKLNTNTNSGKVELLKHSANILAQINNNSTREVYVSSIAKECGIEPTTFNETVNSIVLNNNRLPIKRNYTSYKYAPIQEFPTMSNINTLSTINTTLDRSSVKTYEAERWIIAYISTIFELIPYAKESLEVENFQFNTHKSIFKALCEHVENLTDYNDISIVHSDLTEEYFNNLLEIYNYYKNIIQGIESQQAQWGLLDCIDRLKQPKVNSVDGKIDLLQLKNKKLQEERFKHKNIT